MKCNAFLSTQIIDEFKARVPRERRQEFQKLLMGLVMSEAAPPAGGGPKRMVLKPRFASG